MAKVVYPDWSDGIRAFCGKIRHATQAKAREAMVSSERRGPKPNRTPGKTGVQAQVYFCRTCDAYHWGHID